jgi:hypothetical protein
VNIIFGFGQQDTDAANKMRVDLVEFLIEELEATDFNKINHDLVNYLNKEFIKNQPTHEFNGKQWDRVFIDYPILTKDYKQIIVIIRGEYKAYNNNHPFSPDGFACLSIPFNFSLWILEESSCYLENSDYKRVNVF